MERVKIGIIGCGNISAAYLKYAQQFPNVIEVAALADLALDRAQARAKEFNIPRACGVAELLADPAIQIVVNLTIPKAHFEVALAALSAGKHVYNEKPLALDRKQGRKLLEVAKAGGTKSQVTSHKSQVGGGSIRGSGGKSGGGGLRVGGAPDTFFGAGHQTARKLIDDGAIGRPVAATAFMLCRGHESWHPDPEFYYQPGGGPMFDMGPYYLTALLHMLGPIKRVSGFASVAIPQRTITHKNKDGGPGPKSGQKIDVQTPDHVAGVIEFAAGPIATLVTSFATVHSPHPPITVFGTEGTLAVPDPNGFDGEVRICRGIDGRNAQWETVPFTHRTGYGRMVGVVDMAYAIRSGRPHRASAQQAFTVLEAMQGFLDSSRDGKARVLSPGYERPAPLPTGLGAGELDA